MVKAKQRDSDLKNKLTLDPETKEIKSDRPLSAYTANDDALNPTLNTQGQNIGTHATDINKQTDLELGAIADPGGIDPAADREFLEDMKDHIEKKQAK